VQAAKLRERNEKTTAPARMAQAQESAMRFAQDSKAIALGSRRSFSRLLIDLSIFSGKIPSMTLVKPDTIRLDLPLEAIAELCRKYDVGELSVFGSVLRDDFRPESDVDFLVRFNNDDAGPWMSKFTGLEQDLSKLLGRKVDLVSLPGIEQSENYLRRRHILGSAKAIYVA
jgi:hypothetical protein